MKIRPIQFLMSTVCAVAACFAVVPASAQPLNNPASGGLRTPRLSNAPAAATNTARRQADYIVAVVNSDPITNNEVAVRVARIEQQLAQQGGQRVSRSVILSQTLERMILEKAALQQAKETGIKIDETAVDTAIDNVALQNQVTKAELQRRLAADNVPYDQFRTEIRNQLILAKVREREVSRIRVTDGDIDDYIREQAANAVAGPAEINLAQILVAVPESASQSQVAALAAKAQSVADRARKGDDFAALVSEFSGFAREELRRPDGHENCRPIIRSYSTMRPGTWAWAASLDLCVPVPAFTF